MNKSYTKISLIILFALCIIKMPYWYYQLVRIFGTIGLVHLAYIEHLNKRKFFAITFFILAILFNPIFKIYFGRAEWLIIDVISIIIIIISTYFIKTKIEDV